MPTQPAVAKAKVVIIGPTPPPYHGMTTFTCMLLNSEVLGASYEVLHLETADRRTLENMGRFDLTNVWLALRHAAQLLALVARKRPDVVFVQVSQNALAYLRDTLFILIAKGLGCRVLTHLNGGHFREFYDHADAFSRFLVRRTSALLDGAAVLGAGLRGIYYGLVAREHIHVLPNGIEDPFQDGSPEREAGDGRALNVTYLGSLYGPKGYLDLIDAARLIDPQELDFCFRFAGPWYSPDEEVEARRRAGGDSRISFLGLVAGEKKSTLLRETDILVLPTGYPLEGQPQVVLEAMAAGVPVVVTPRAAIPDMVTGGETGLFVPEHDPPAIAASLSRLALDPQERLRMGRRARARFLAEFTAERCAGRLVALLDGIRSAPRVASAPAPGEAV